jgi:hypothetical protein
VVHHAPVDGDAAAGDVFQPGEHAQQRRLAAARRPDQHHELAVGDVERDAVQDFGFSEVFFDFLKCDRSHQLFTAPLVSPATM